MMNYIVEIKAFQDMVQIKQLSTGQIALWYALMYINNKCAWIEWFTAPNLTLELNTGLSRSGIQKARNVLKQHGFIDFKANGTRATSYKLISIAKSNQVSAQVQPTTSDSTQDGNQDSTQDGNQGGNQDSNQVGGTLNKLNETKQKSSASTQDSSKKENDLVEAFFEKNWSLYPSKKGKGQISNSKKKELYKLGDEFERCISRYKKFVEVEREKGFQALKFQNGSTFFNSGYVDYLDINQAKEDKKPQRPPLKLVIRDNY